MNSNFKLMMCMSISALSISLLSAQNPSKRVDHSKIWPSKNSPKATWEIIKPNGPRPKTPSDEKSSYVFRTSFMVRGTFKGQSFTLRYINPDPGTFDSGSLVLSINGKEQIFTKINPDWRLDWAGDADGDGKLDLVIGSVGEGGGSNSYLFLSSLTAKGELLNHADEVIEEGC